MKLNKDGYLKDCEALCFDCGSTPICDDGLVVISPGVALCLPCYKVAEDDYPKDK